MLASTSVTPATIATPVMTESVSETPLAKSMREAKTLCEEFPGILETANAIAIMKARQQMIHLRREIESLDPSRGPRSSEATDAINLLLHTFVSTNIASAVAVARYYAEALCTFAQNDDLGKKHIQTRAERQDWYFNMPAIPLEDHETPPTLTQRYPETVMTVVLAAQQAVERLAIACQSIIPPGSEFIPDFRAAIITEAQEGLRSANELKQTLKTLSLIPPNTVTAS